jgi:hypothetical protein
MVFQIIDKNVRDILAQRSKSDAVAIRRPGRVIISRRGRGQDNQAGAIRIDLQGETYTSLFPSGDQEGWQAPS